MSKNNIINDEDFAAIFEEELEEDGTIFEEVDFFEVDEEMFDTQTIDTDIFGELFFEEF